MQLWGKGKEKNRGNKESVEDNTRSERMSKGDREMEKLKEAGYGSEGAEGKKRQREEILEEMRKAGRG